MEKVLLVILFIIIVILIISIIRCYIRIDISSFDVNNNKIDKNIKLLFLSDLHNRNIIKRLDKIIRDIKPDIIICGGDMVNEGLKGGSNFIKAIPLFKDYKTYYTFGNHEQIIKENNSVEYNEYVKNINKTSIILLNNKCESLSKNIKLYGLNYDLSYYHKFGELGLNSQIINNCIGNINKENFNILISHNPLEFKNYVDYEVDLVLSGHVHGGVIKVPFLGALLSPNFTFFPKYYEGEYKKNKTTMIVSRGLGFSTKIPFRIFNHPEVVVINIKKK